MTDKTRLNLDPEFGIGIVTIGEATGKIVFKEPMDSRVNEGRLKDAIGHVTDYQQLKLFDKELPLDLARELASEINFAYFQFTGKWLNET